MMTEKEIISRIRRKRYAAQRAGCGFWDLLKNPNAIGNLLVMLERKHEASELEWVLGYSVPVKELNWYQKAKKIYRRKQLI